MRSKYEETSFFATTETVHIIMNRNGTTKIYPKMFSLHIFNSLFANEFDLSLNSLSAPTKSSFRL